MVLGMLVYFPLVLSSVAAGPRPFKQLSRGDSFNPYPANVENMVSSE